ncbi:DUF7130 family rubredoxin-like protein [Halosimplex carlsbadense]|nr:hypothetical protein [Halosimplex carlsbadense]
MSDVDEETDLGFGQAVFDDEGNRLGTVRGFDEHGFYVTTEDGIAGMGQHLATTADSGEAELMWRCWDCGEMGDIEAIPETCPACGAERESIYYWTED